MKIFRYNDITERNALKKIINSAVSRDSSAVKTASGIIKAVRKSGDKALFAFSKKYDKFRANSGNLKVKQNELDSALKKLPKNVISALKRAKTNIEKYHKKQLYKGYTYKTPFGKLKMRAVPVESAGVYIPGGKAVYPSSVLMNVIPAKLAGVKRIVMCTPAYKGKVSPAILAAAKICGISEIYKLGGAQAIAALAYGTESVKPVVKITGPGNMFVAAAKQLVYGKVGIDSIAGPSEVLIVATNGNNPEIVAADMLAQAEHDEEARSILVSDSMAFAGKVMMFLSFQKAFLSRKDIVDKSLRNSIIVIVDKIKDAIEVSNYIAPEHLELLAKEAVKDAKYYKNAGAVFLGENSTVAYGDYIIGTNHVLPTSGAAKFSSPLGVYDFVKYQSTAEITKNGVKILAADLKTLALTEGLDGHANSVAIRGAEGRRRRGAARTKRF